MEEPVPTYSPQTTPQTAAVVLLTGTALAALVAAASYWTWEWFAPRHQARASAAAVAGDGPLAATGLFGQLEPSAAKAQPAAQSFKLLGILASPVAGDGYVILQGAAREVLSVREGQEISPGVRVALVATDHIEVERNGLRETLQWPEGHQRTVEPFAERGDIAALKTINMAARGGR